MTQDFKAYNYWSKEMTHKVVDHKHVELGLLGKPHTVYFKSLGAAMHYAKALSNAGHGFRYQVFPCGERE